MEVEIVPRTKAMEGNARPQGRLNLKTAVWLQDWATITFTVIIIVVEAIYTAVANPIDRPFTIYDGTISMPYVGDSTIPYWVVPTVGIISMLLSLAVFELLWGHRHGIAATNAVASFIFFLVDFISAAAVNVLLTDISKILVGRYRPDWLDRCQPAVPSTIAVEYGQPASLNPACLQTTLSESKISDGHKSFPSGHSSTAFVLGAYIAGYCLWAAFHRTSRTYAPEAGKERFFKDRLLADVASMTTFIWILWNISWAWGVAVSRVMDNKHHPSDVVSGAFLGTLVAVTFLVRAVSRQSRVMQAPERLSEPLLSHSVVPGVALSNA